MEPSAPCLRVGPPPHRPLHDKRVPLQPSLPRQEGPHSAAPRVPVVSPGRRQVPAEQWVQFEVSGLQGEHAAHADQQQNHRGPPHRPHRGKDGEVPRGARRGGRDAHAQYHSAGFEVVCYAPIDQCHSPPPHSRAIVGWGVTLIGALHVTRFLMQYQIMCTITTCDKLAFVMYK